MLPDPTLSSLMLVKITLPGMISPAASRRGRPLAPISTGVPSTCSAESLTSTKGETLPTPTRLRLNLMTVPASITIRTPRGRSSDEPSCSGNPLLAKPIW